MKNILKQFKEGVITNNPIFVQFLGMCPTLAVTTSVVNAIGMGCAVIAVLVSSNLLISLLRKFIPKQVRIASYIVIISGFVTAVELVIKAYLPAVNSALGLFIPLIVVNCIILARAEAFASKNGPLPSVIDGLAMGIGYSLALIIIAAVREALGTGVIFADVNGAGGIKIFGEGYPPATLFILPPGAFLTLGFLVAGVQKIMQTIDDGKRKKAAKAKPAESFSEISEEISKEENSECETCTKKTELSEEKEEKSSQAEEKQTENEEMKEEENNA